MTSADAAGAAQRLLERLEELRQAIDDQQAARSLGWAADHLRTAAKRLATLAEREAVDHERA